MKQRSFATGVLLLVMAIVAAGVVGCSRPAREREPQTTDSEAVPATSVSPSEGEGSPAPGETVVSAVTPAPETPGTQEQPTQVVIGETPAVAEPTATSESGAVTEVEATVGPPPSTTSGGTVWHTVQRGETLSSIARRYGTTWRAIARANGLANPNQIYAGQKLEIPAASSGSATTSSGTTGGCRIRHTVKPGEWVWQIARNYGVSPYDILAANGLTIQSANTINPGKVLCIP
jgi:LysM repeat protein